MILNLPHLKQSLQGQRNPLFLQYFSMETDGIQQAAQNYNKQTHREVQKLYNLSWTMKMDRKMKL